MHEVQDVVQLIIINFCQLLYFNYNYFFAYLTIFYLLKKCFHIDLNKAKNEDS